MTHNYFELFSRNLGIVSPSEQEILKKSRVAVAGVGGVGGSYAITLARMGVGEFHLADPDSFEAANMNRQAGAFFSKLGRKKVDVIREMILDINPEAKVKVFYDGVTPQNVSEFLDAVNVVMDGIDFYALDARRLVFPEAEKRGIYIVTSGPLGFSTTLHIFGPGAMSFEEYFDLKNCKTAQERQASFLVGVGPAGLHMKHIDLRYVDISKGTSTSFSTAIQLCAGLACTHAALLLLKRKKPFLAPHYFQFDPVRLRLKKKYLWLGNRNPIQRLKRKIVLSLLQKHIQKTPPARSNVMKPNTPLASRLYEWTQFARWAPSGDNSQPWAIRYRESGSQIKVQIYIQPDYRSAKHFFDVQLVATYFALGAFYNNLKQVAELDGMKCVQEPTHAKSGAEDIFEVVFEGNPKANSELNPNHPKLRTIRDRRVNRYPFKKTELPLDLLKEIVNKGKEHTTCALISVTQREEIKKLAKTYYRLDLVRYFNLSFLHEFLTELRFGKEPETTQDGLDYRTLCVDPPVWGFLRLVRKFRWLVPFYSLTCSQSTAYVGCYRLLMNCGGIFLLSSKEENAPLAWFKLGMAFQDLWLLATENGLQFQPFGTPLILFQQGLAKSGQINNIFSDRETKILDDCHARFLKHAGVDTYRPCMSFRLGYGPQAPQYSYRKEVPISTF